MWLGHPGEEGGRRRWTRVRAGTLALPHNGGTTLNRTFGASGPSALKCGQ